MSVYFGAPYQPPTPIPTTQSVDEGAAQTPFRVDPIVRIIIIAKYASIILFSLYFHSYITITKHIWVSIFYTTALPVLLFIYHDYDNIITFRRLLSEDRKHEFLEKELYNEEVLMKVIPAITFGLALIISVGLDKTVTHQLIPYLATTLLFGTIIPLVMSLFTTSKSSSLLLGLESVITSVELSSIGYLTCSLVLIFMHYTDGLELKRIRQLKRR